MRKRTCWMIGCGLILLLALLAGQGQPQPKINTKDVMKFKLYYAQGVLEGITMENFDLITTNAQKLASLSQAADWQIRQTPEYQKFTMDYARQANALGKAAKNKNVDAATVAYFQLTVSCVNCHRYLRGASTVGNDFAPPKPPFVNGLWPERPKPLASSMATAPCVPLLPLSSPISHFTLLNGWSWPATRRDLHPQTVGQCGTGFQPVNRPSAAR